MPVLDRLKSFVRCGANPPPKTTRKPATTNNTQPYTQNQLGATAIPAVENPMKNRQVENTQLLTTQNWVNANTMKLYFVPEAEELADYDAKTLIESPLFMQPQTVARYRDVLAIIDSLAPEGSNVDTITENIEKFSKEMKAEDFFWTTALKFSLANKLIGQLQYILRFIQEGNNLPEEDIIGENLICRPNQKWALKVKQSNLKAPMTAEEQNTKANSISSTFQLLINRLFQNMSDKVNDGYFAIENAEKYRNLIQEITTITIPMRRNYDSIETKIATINIVHEDIKNMIGNLKRLLSLS